MKKTKITELTGTLRELVLGSGVSANDIYDNVFIMYHRKQDNFPIMVKLYKWPTLQTSGEIADGVVVVYGGKVLVVAPTQASETLFWSSAALSGGGYMTADRVAAINDWAGKANTAAQIAASTPSAITDTDSYAPGFCNLYSRINANGEGLNTGQWWLPSLGELMMMYANFRKINYALSLINGSTPLIEGAYWSSTEYSAPYAWHLTFNYGYLRAGSKATGKLYVRPVSAFIG